MSNFTYLDWAMVVFITLVVISSLVGFIWVNFFDKFDKDEKEY